MAPGNAMDFPDRRQRLQQRRAEIHARLVRLKDGQVADDIDLRCSEEALAAALQRSSDAHVRAATAHRRAAKMHRRFAEYADAHDQPTRADEHRTAARADEEAAARHIGEARADLAAAKAVQTRRTNLSA